MQMPWSERPITHGRSKFSRRGVGDLWCETIKTHRKNAKGRRARNWGWSVKGDESSRIWN
jgi:hypothetical protein